eukprot:SAG25_NODE_272_length_10613_cov_6.416191_8_plen_97_part_00
MRGDAPDGAVVALGEQLQPHLRQRADIIIMIRTQDEIDGNVGKTQSVMIVALVICGSAQPCSPTCASVRGSSRSSRMSLLEVPTASVLGPAGLQRY